MLNNDDDSGISDRSLIDVNELLHKTAGGGGGGEGPQEVRPGNV